MNTTLNLVVHQQELKARVEAKKLSDQGFKNVTVQSYQQVIVSEADNLPTFIRTNVWVVIGEK
jgi:uncharacterized protein (UPF0147 family)